MRRLVWDGPSITRADLVVCVVKPSRLSAGERTDFIG
jgi:hypothetical protein